MSIITTGLITARTADKLDRKQKLSQLAEKAARLHEITGVTPLSYAEFSERQSRPDATSEGLALLKQVAVTMMAAVAIGVVSALVLGNPVTLTPTFVALWAIAGGAIGLSIAVSQNLAKSHESIGKYDYYLQSFEAKSRGVSPDLSVESGLGLTSNLSQRISAERSSQQSRRR